MFARRHNFAVDDKNRIGIAQPCPDDSTGEQGFAMSSFLPEIIAIKVLSEHRSRTTSGVVCQLATAAMARRIRCSLTGLGVPSCCAHRLTLNSSIIRPMSTTSGATARLGGRASAVHRKRPEPQAPGSSAPRSPTRPCGSFSNRRTIAVR